MLNCGHHTSRTKKRFRSILSQTFCSARGQLCGYGAVVSSSGPAYQLQFSLLSSGRHHISLREAYLTSTLTRVLITKVIKTSYWITCAVLATNRGEVECSRETRNTFSSTHSWVASAFSSVKVTLRTNGTRHITVTRLK